MNNSEFVVHDELKKNRHVENDSSELSIHFYWPMAQRCSL